MRLSDRVLLIGCGTGRDLLALRQLGYDVTGLEQSTALADEARATLSTHGLPTEVIPRRLSRTPHTTRSMSSSSRPTPIPIFSAWHRALAILGRLRECLVSSRKSDHQLSAIDAAILGVDLSCACQQRVCRQRLVAGGRRSFVRASRRIRRRWVSNISFHLTSWRTSVGLAGLQIVRDEPISSYFRFAVASV